MEQKKTQAGQPHTRLKRARIVAAAGLAILGSGLLALAIQAFRLGIDHNPAWGGKRTLLALLGAACLLLSSGLFASTPLRRAVLAVQDSSVYRNISTRIGRAGRSLGSSVWTHRWVQAAARVQAWPIWKPFQQHPLIWAWTGAGLAILTGLWYITSGTLHVWTPYSHYFDRLADSFRAGQLYLLEKPPANLLALPNPYDWRSRQGIAILWDASLYQGKYYLYWGPVPALLAAAVKIFRSVTVEDQNLLMLFYGGLAIVLGLQLEWLRKQFFAHSPAWSVLPLTLLGGLSAPVFWLVNRPSVYETAIAGGQFFLLLGIYAALKGMTGVGRQRIWLLVAGLSWGAAVNCRLNNAVAVIWMSGLVCIYLIYIESREPDPQPSKNEGKRSRAYGIEMRQSRIPWKRIEPALRLLLPLVLWALGLVWYNDARFGNIFETGHRYQLTGPALPADYRQVVSFAYILPNLYSTLLRPAAFSPGNFPFVILPYISEKMWPWFIHLPPAYYYSEPIAGVLMVVPAFWLAILPLLGAVKSAWNWLAELPPPTAVARPVALRWAWWILAGAGLCSLASLLLFISSSMRYLADIAPLMTLLSALGLWWGLDFFRSQPAARRVLLFLAVLLCLASILISLFANFTNGDKRFETNNPALYHAIAQLFTRGK